MESILPQWLEASIMLKHNTLAASNAISQYYMYAPAQSLLATHVYNVFEILLLLPDNRAFGECVK